MMIPKHFRIGLKPFNNVPEQYTTLIREGDKWKIDSPPSDHSAQIRFSKERLEFLLQAGYIRIIEIIED